VKRIASRANPFLKRLRQVAAANSRARRDGWVWLEGVHLCQEYLQRIGQPMHAVFDARAIDDDLPPDVALYDRGIDSPASGSHNEAVQRQTELHALFDAVAPDKQILIENGLLEGVSDIAAMQGVGFVIEQPQAIPTSPIDHTCVILDRIQDPGNVGSIIRTCAAAGVRTVVLLEGTASAWSGKVLRAGQGAHFSLQLYDQITAEQAASLVAVPVLATSLAQAQSLYANPLPMNCAWVFGHEGHGVGGFWLQHSTRRVFIPQAEGVESLNVAAAAAVCLFEQRRQWLGA